MREVLGSLTKSCNSLKITQDEFGQATFSGVPFQIIGGDRIRINDNIFDSFPGIYEDLSLTSYSGKPMKDELDILMMKNITNNSGYRGIGDQK